MLSSLYIVQDVVKRTPWGGRPPLELFPSNRAMFLRLIEEFLKLLYTLIIVYILCGGFEYGMNIYIYIYLFVIFFSVMPYRNVRPMSCRGLAWRLDVDSTAGVGSGSGPAVTEEIDLWQKWKAINNSLQEDNNNIILIIKIEILTINAGQVVRQLDGFADENRLGRLSLKAGLKSSDLMRLEELMMSLLKLKCQLLRWAECVELTLNDGAATRQMTLVKVTRMTAMMLLLLLRLEMMAWTVLRTMSVNDNKQLI